MIDVYNIDILEMPSIPKVDLIIADPPYFNVLNAKWDRQWKDINSYVLWSEKWIRTVLPFLKDTGNFYIFGGVGEKSDSIIHIKLLLDKMLYFKDWITWAKSRGMGNRKGWMYTREELLWYVKDNKQFMWNTEAQYSNERRKRDGGKNIIRESQNGYKAKSLYKRYTNVWTDISEQTYDVIRSPNHPTPKPQKLIERIILAHTQPGDIVLDPFMGTGNVGIVCKQQKRNYIGIDKELQYVNEAKERLYDR